MSLVLKIVLIITSVIVTYLYVRLTSIPNLPVLEEKWWGPGLPQKDDPTIRPFKIDVPKEVIKDLHRRLDTALPFQPPLEGVNQHYGMNTNLLKTIVEYWRHQYNWTERQAFFNQFPHFKTKIQGIDIHFLHVKPKNVPKGVEVVPILLVHGWPGSVREFYEMIPILITPQKDRNFVFEVVVPSLPGYGFSDGAARPGMNPARIAQIFNTLMQRLNFKRYYIQGGDWGSSITHDIALFYPNSVIGIHRNWCFVQNIFRWKVIAGAIFPSLFVTEKEAKLFYPLTDKFADLLLESGYFHLHATKPDTVGVAERDSAVGMAAYILEKFPTWTNPAWNDLPDAGLTKHFTMDQLLDNLMVYWVTRSFTTAARLYSEGFGLAYQSLKLDDIPIEVPAGCNRFDKEIVFYPEWLLREQHKQLVHLTDHEGGHFAAFEVPEVLGNDVVEFVGKVRSLGLDVSHKEL